MIAASKKFLKDKNLKSGKLFLVLLKVPANVQVTRFLTENMVVYPTVVLLKTRYL